MTPKPVVALLTAGELFGGVERQLLGLCHWFRRQGADPILILFMDRELARHAREMGVEPIILHSGGSFDLGVPGRLAAELRTRGVNVVHAHGYRAVVNAALARRNHRFALVRTVHGLVEPSARLSATWLKSHTYDWLEGTVARWLDAPHCYVTDDLRRRRTGGGSEPAPGEFVVRNGIDPLTAADFARPEDLPADRYHFAAVGRVTPVKGLETALRAFGSLDVPGNVVLDIIGTGPSIPGLKRLAADLDLDSRVRFCGFRANIYDYLAHIDALIMPSHHEGLPYTILETMSLAKPIIASRVGGLAEVLRHDETALLVEPEDVDGWCEAMGRAVRSPAAMRELGRAAREDQTAHYTLNGMGTAYQAIYAQCLAERDRQGTERQ